MTTGTKTAVDRTIVLTVDGVDRAFTSSNPGDSAILSVLQKAREHGALSEPEYGRAIHTLGTSRYDWEAFERMQTENSSISISSSRVA